MTRRVLVVDDSRTSRLFIIQSLEMAGLAGSEFIQAGNGNEAIAIIKSSDSFDFLVTDINMPQKCGMTMMKEISEQKLNNGFKIFVISSTQNPVRDAELKELGATAVLQKPIQMPHLVAAISLLKTGA